MDILNSHQVPVLWCDDANTDEAAVSFRACDAEVLLSAAYPQIFKPPLLAIAPQGIFNSHPSLLPRCRGAHPVFWAIASGEIESGATIHYMTEQLDRGDIVSQIKVEIFPDDTRSKLYDRLISKIPDLIFEFITFLDAPNKKARAQDDRLASYFRNDRQIHHCIFWRDMNADQIQNLVRACEGSANFWHEARRIQVLKTEVHRSNRNLTNGIVVPPGTVVDVQNGFPVIASRDGFVKLVKLTAPLLCRVNFIVGQVIH